MVWLVSVTFAPGTIAPDGSVTTPMTLEVVRPKLHVRRTNSAQIASGGLLTS